MRVGNARCRFAPPVLPGTAYLRMCGRIFLNERDHDDKHSISDTGRRYGF